MRSNWTSLPEHRPCVKHYDPAKDTKGPRAAGVSSEALHQSPGKPCKQTPDSVGGVITGQAPVPEEEVAPRPRIRVGGSDTRHDTVSELVGTAEPSPLVAQRSVIRVGGKPKDTFSLGGDPEQPAAQHAPRNEAEERKRRDGVSHVFASGEEPQTPQPRRPYHNPGMASHDLFGQEQTYDRPPRSIEREQALMEKPSPSSAPGAGLVSWCPPEK